VDDIRLLMVGRQFRLPHGGWLVLGRKEQENEQVLELRQPDDYLLKLKDRPGPTGLLRYATDHQDLELAAGLVVRYGKKIPAQTAAGPVKAERAHTIMTLNAFPVADSVFQPWLI